LNQKKRNLPIFPAPTELKVAQVVRKPVNKSLLKEKESSIKCQKRRKTFRWDFLINTFYFSKASLNSYNVMPLQRSTGIYVDRYKRLSAESHKEAFMDNEPACHVLLFHMKRW